MIRDDTIWFDQLVRKLPVNIDNIVPGKIYKNYRELCEALGEKPITNANYRKKQIDNWKRFIEIEQIPGSYQILVKRMLFSTQQGFVERRARIFLKETELKKQLAYKFLQGFRDSIAQQNENRLILTTLNASNAGSLINSNYANASKCRNKLSGIDPENAKWFFAKTNEINEGHIVSALNFLKNKLGVLSYSSGFQTISSTGKRKLWLNQNELILIDEAAEICRKMGLRNKGDAFFKGRLGEFYIKLREVLIEKYQVEYHEKVFVVYVSQRSLDWAEEEMLKILEEEENLSSAINERAVERRKAKLQTEINRFNRKDKEVDAWIDTSGAGSDRKNTKEYRPNNYEIVQAEMIERYIKKPFVEENPELNFDEIMSSDNWEEFEIQQEEELEMSYESWKEMSNSMPEEEFNRILGRMDESVIEQLKAWGLI